MQNIVLKITENDRNIFVEILENYLSDLSMEITNTDRLEYREKLKAKRSAVQRILIKLKGGNEDI